ncbi:unnamed protein product [Arabis nemorensis]|uniref:Uncharacterized protein n=1 Tax=Arabis nemorensis TaxID=586526 RepID=A0A565CAY3_9BRAS|nr:unnamed protein product [Arabis nemorensis]
MMQRRSPPKHRHDGTSPLPLGMDWSPPPRKWSATSPKCTTTNSNVAGFKPLRFLSSFVQNGRDTVWPHDPRTGWSYCVTIPSWVVLPKSRNSDPVVKWITKLIELARSVVLASFLELEAAARSACQDVDQNASDANNDRNSTSSSPMFHPSLSLFQAGGSSFLTSDYGSDTAYETSELGSPSLGQDDISEIESSNHSVMHDRKFSVESADGFALHTGETSTSGLLSSSSDSHLDSVSHERETCQWRNRYGGSYCKTKSRDSGEGLAVKDYLNKKVNDLEGELETTKQRSKENLEQAIMTERERFTQMQWDMEELRKKSYEMEMKLKSGEDGGSHAEPTELSTISEKYVLSKELDARKQQLEDLSRRCEELEAKSKADIKVLVKEVKSLRRSHVELEKELTQSLTDKTETEKLLQEERKVLENTVAARKKLLSDCRIIHDRLKEYNLNLSMDGSGNFVEDSTTAHLLAGFDENAAAQGTDKDPSIDTETRIMEDELRKILANIFVENAKLRKQVNSAMLRALQKDGKTTTKDVNEESGDEKEEAPAETLDI